MPAAPPPRNAHVDETLARATAVIDALAASLPLTTAWLFGSGAAGRLRPDSDLDLGLLFAAPVDPSTLAALSADVAAIAGRPVQLVDLGRAGPIVGRQVLEYGVLLRDDEPKRRHAGRRPGSRKGREFGLRDVVRSRRAWPTPTDTVPPESSRKIR